ncbi:MAG TPA: hypothetical protein VKY81_11820 [Natronosporangium sp.]|nr:hypothetical protein [Natronosporangium sp.]
MLSLLLVIVIGVLLGMIIGLLLPVLLFVGAVAVIAFFIADNTAVPFWVAFVVVAVIGLVVLANQ